MLAKAKIELEVEIEIDEEEYQDLEIADVVKGICLYPDDAVDGFVITTELEGYDKTSDFFIKDMNIKERSILK